MGFELIHVPLQLLHQRVGFVPLRLDRLEAPPHLLALLHGLLQARLQVQPSVGRLHGLGQGLAGLLQPELGVLPQAALLLQKPLELAEHVSVVALLLLALVLLRDHACLGLR